MAVKATEREAIARATYVRVSASKARAVIDLIRNQDVVEASRILKFSNRAVAADVSKILDSAVANAEHKLGLTPEELVISRAFVDEGPTMKRWRPRARGRATRIRKRTCHITIAVSGVDEDEL